MEKTVQTRENTEGGKRHSKGISWNYQKQKQNKKTNAVPFLKSQIISQKEIIWKYKF